MQNVLIVSGHPDLNDSVANKAILEELETRLPKAQFDLLDSLYPDFAIDAAAEQEKLTAADVIVLQFPLFWYSMPSLLSRWMEKSFTHGFSHGAKGNRLHGKKLVLSITAGAPEEMYSKGGAMGYSVEEFFHAADATCRLTGMESAGTVTTYGVSYQSRTDEPALRQIRQKAAEHAERVAKLVESL